MAKKRTKNEAAFLGGWTAAAAHIPYESRNYALGYLDSVLRHLVADTARGYEPHHFSLGQIAAVLATGIRL